MPETVPETVYPAAALQGRGCIHEALRKLVLAKVHARWLADAAGSDASPLSNDKWRTFWFVACVTQGMGGPWLLGECTTVDPHRIARTCLRLTPVLWMCLTCHAFQGMQGSFHATFLLPSKVHAANVMAVHNHPCIPYAWHLIE